MWGIGIAVLAACSGDVPSAGGGCDQAIDPMSVSSGLHPQFSWSPACEAILEVSHQGSGGGVDVWFVGKVRPPVTYGVVPAGATGSSAVPLMAGEPYHAELNLQLSNQSVIITAQRDFVP